MHKAVNAVNAFVLFFSTAVLILELCTHKDCTVVLTFGLYLVLGLYTTKDCYAVLTFGCAQAQILKLCSLLVCARAQIKKLASFWAVFEHSL